MDPQVLQSCSSSIIFQGPHPVPVRQGTANSNGEILTQITVFMKDILNLKVVGQGLVSKCSFGSVRTGVYCVPPKPEFIQNSEHDLVWKQSLCRHNKLYKDRP